MVIITVFSVGYEEVEPVSTHTLRIITMLIIVAGDASKVYFVGSLVQFITEGEIGKAMEEHRKSRDIDSIKDHAIICGYGRIGQVLARELEAKEFPFLILDNNAERVALAQTHGYQALLGDAGRGEHALRGAHRAGGRLRHRSAQRHGQRLHHAHRAEHAARPCASSPARRTPPRRKSSSRPAPTKSSCPPSSGGMQIANSITHPSLDSILKDGSRHLNNDLKELGVEIVEHPIVANGVNDRKTVQQLLRGIESNCLVLAVKKPDELAHPASAGNLPARGQRYRRDAVAWTPCFLIIL